MHTLHILINLYMASISRVLMLYGTPVGQPSPQLNLDSAKHCTTDHDYNIVAIL